MSTTPHAVFEEIAAHKRGDDLARLDPHGGLHRRRRAPPRASPMASPRWRGAPASPPRTQRPRSATCSAPSSAGGAESAGSATRALLAALLARGVAPLPAAGRERGGAGRRGAALALDQHLDRRPRRHRRGPRRQGGGPVARGGHPGPPRRRRRRSAARPGRGGDRGLGAPREHLRRGARRGAGPRHRGARSHRALAARRLAGRRRRQRIAALAAGELSTPPRHPGEADPDGRHGHPPGDARGPARGADRPALPPPRGGPHHRAAAWSLRSKTGAARADAARARDGDPRRRPRARHARGRASPPSCSTQACSRWRSAATSAWRSSSTAPAWARRR